MAVTGVQKAERSLYLSYIEKIANSHTLHNSESLRKLLHYLAEHALDHPGFRSRNTKSLPRFLGVPLPLILNWIRPSECRQAAFV